MAEDDFENKNKIDDLGKEKKQWIKEILSKVTSPNVRKCAVEQLQKRGLLKSNLVFGSTIPAIAKVNLIIAYSHTKD